MPFEASLSCVRIVWSVYDPVVVLKSTHPVTKNTMNDGHDSTRPQSDEDPSPKASILGRTGMRCKDSPCGACMRRVSASKQSAEMREADRRRRSR